MTTSHDAAVPAAGITRLQLLDWILPHCEPGDLACLYAGKGDDEVPGWIHDSGDVSTAIAAYRDGTLARCSFRATNKKNVDYQIRSISRIGVVPHHDGLVTVFCIDLDDHTGSGGTAGLRPQIARFLGSDPVTFTSRGGRGYHLFFRLAVPMPVTDFHSWTKSWGFNRAGHPEAFPKTTKLTQVFLPNEPNDRGGDAYLSGTFESCVVKALPSAPKAKLSDESLRFLRGETPESGRNIALNKTAFELGLKRVPGAVAESLCGFGAHLCGLDHAETASTFDSGFRSGKVANPRPAGADAPADRDGDDAGQRRIDGIGDAERFIDQHGEDVRFCWQTESWLVWKGDHWGRDARGEVDAKAKMTARSIKRDMEEAVERMTAEGLTADAISKVRRLYERRLQAAASCRGIREMLTLARSDVRSTVDIDALDADPMLLNAPNGTVDLRRGVLRPHVREDLITKMVSARFDANALCPRWDAFVDRVFGGDQDLIAFVRRAVGYALTGDVSEQCLFFLLGSGQNGKSVFMQTLLSLFGDYGQKAPTAILVKEERSSAGGATPDVARLKGARLVVTAELEEGQRLAEARIKDLTGGDRLSARELWKNPFEFSPSHTLFVYGNHRPVIRGTDHGIWRRIRLIPMTVTIPEGEKEPHLDKALATELEGILAWAVRGCLEWQEGGLIPPAIVLHATDEYRGESDMVLQFVSECCRTETTTNTSKAELYAAYRQFCANCGETPLSINAFGTRLIALGFKDAQRSAKGRSWSGIEIGVGR